MTLTKDRGLPGINTTLGMQARTEFSNVFISVVSQQESRAKAIVGYVQLTNF